MSNEEIFDPEIHAVDKKGNPSLNKDGSFRKKRRDARGAAAGTARTKSTAGAGGSRVLAEQRARYHKSVAEVAQVGVTLASFADPVIGYAAGSLAPMWADVLADLAMENPRLAAALDKAGNLGAIGGAVGVLLLTGAQFGHLAGRIPGHIVKMLGGATREEIEQILKQRGEQLARERGQQSAPAHPADRAEAVAHG